MVLEVVKIFMSEHIYLIDLDRVIHDKMGKKARFVPRFLLNYLKKIIHQDELNVFLKGETGSTLALGLCSLFGYEP